MKKSIFILLVLVIILSGCDGLLNKNDQGDKTVTKKHIEIPQDEESCIAAGGVWKVIGLAPRPQCNLRTSDFNRECNDSDECEGSCMTTLSEEDLEKVKDHKTVKTSGTCSEWIIIVGCRTFVEDGKVDNIMCID